MQRQLLVRRVAPVAVFAVVLAALLALNAVSGGGGDGDGTRRPRPLPVSIGFRTAGEAAGTGRAPGDTAASMPAMYGSEIVIPDRLLAGQPTQGPAYEVASGDTSTARIAGLAKALGVSGEVRGDADGWVAGEGDRVLRVYRQPGTHWHLGPDKGVARPADGVAVAEPVTASAEPEPRPSAEPEPGDTPVSSDTDPGCQPPPDGGVCVAPVPACPPPPPGAEPAPCDPPRPLPEPSKPPQPTDAEARAAAQRVFDAAGLAGAAVTLNDAWIGKEVVAAPVVDGLPTVGIETRVTVVADGSIAYANGSLAGADVAADYPLLAPRDAVTRGRYGPPHAMVDYACPEAEPCPTPEPREATGLRLGLMFLPSYDGTGAAYLAPAWLLRFADGPWEEPVLALPDEYVATPPPARDTPATDAPPPPGEAPVDGGAGSGGGSTGSTGTAGSTGTEPAPVGPSPSAS